MSRQGSNKALLQMLEGLVEAYPDLRFSQILANFEFVKQGPMALYNPDDENFWVDEYHLEPDQLLARVDQAIIKYCK